MDDGIPTSDVFGDSSRDLWGADALSAAEAAVEAFEAGDFETCLALLDRAERAVRAVATEQEEQEDAGLTVRGVEAAIEAARSGLDAGADDADTRVRRSLATVRHAVNLLDPAAATHRVLDGPG